MRAVKRSLLILTTVAMHLLGAEAAQADDSHGAFGENTGDSAEVGVNQDKAGDQGATGDGDGGDGGNDVRCWNDGLRHTTQEEQRNDIREEETAGREGEWGWRVCDDGRPDELMFFPDEEPVDPEFLARSVVITPPPPQLRANPDIEGSQLVNFDTWFWVDRASWRPITAEATLGAVWAQVTATPATLVIDPGDGSGELRCEGGGTPYDAGRSANSQSSDCTHEYKSSGHFTATATVVYNTTWTSNVPGAGGSLGPLTPPDAQFTIAVAESQAVVTD